MVLYVFITGYMGAWLVSYTGISCKYKNYTTVGIAILSMTLPVILIGLRTNVADTLAYSKGFNNLSTDFSVVTSALGDSKGPGWLIYEWFIKRFVSTDVNIFFMITAIIQAGGIIKLYYKFSDHYPFSISLFFMSGSFYYMLNGIRQFMALAFMLYFLDWFFEKKYIRFAIVILIAMTIHTTIILWIPIMFIVQGKPWNKKTLFFIALILMAVTSVSQFTDLLETALTDTVYEGITEQFAFDDGSNIIRTIIAAVPVFLSLLGKEIIEKAEDQRINILVNLSIVNTLISLLANFTSGILIGRLNIYFSVFSFALYPWLIKNIFNRNSARVMNIMCYVGYLGYAIYYLRNLAYISDILRINTLL